MPNMVRPFETQPPQHPTAMKQRPKITFGIIVLNGEPFTRYNLRALYPFAYEIIVVEGASPNATHASRDDGHSVDGTLELLYEFKANEDIENKITIITAESEGYLNGFWPGEKDEQSQAYAKRATGEYLWQIDIDEFYLEEDMERVIKILTYNPLITAVTFPEIPFWGDFNTVCDGILLRMSYSKFHRLFKWGPGYSMITHRPPTVIDAEGKDMREMFWLNDRIMKDFGIFLRHYTQIFPGQVGNKMIYYKNLIDNTNGNSNWIKNVENWYGSSFSSLSDPYHVHTVNNWPSWLVRFYGRHPSQIEDMIFLIEKGDINACMRNMDDANKLLISRKYKIGIIALKFWGDYFVQGGILLRKLLRGHINILKFGIEFFDILIGRSSLFRNENRR